MLSRRSKSMSDITRFIKAQERTHASALRELKNGYKASHWSWWEIPQIIGLGMTSTSREYAIKDMEERRQQSVTRNIFKSLFLSLILLKKSARENNIGRSQYSGSPRGRDAERDNRVWGCCGSGNLVVLSVVNVLLLHNIYILIKD